MLIRKQERLIEPNMAHHLNIYPTPDALTVAAADLFLERVQSSSGRFTVVLAGGSTPLPIYRLLATDAYASRIDWGRVHVFFGDERCVPPTHPHSNYNSIQDAFLAHVAIPLENVHRMRGELPPEEGAMEYGRMLKAFFDGGAPTFDLQFLGMGDDGHTASLFPHVTAALEETHHRVVATGDTHHPHARLTLTAWAINASREVVVLVAGQGKSAMLKAVLEGNHQPHQYPIQLIAPTNGTLRWFVDAAAASQLR